jgi:trehalose 6-phosphate synthase
MGWTRERLEEVVRARIGNAKLIVVANREPYIHRRQDGVVRCTRPASGLTTALDPVMRACGGVWVAHGSGDADREVCDANGRVEVPPDHPAYILRRVWLSKEEEDRYYYGFANSTLWPLCHQAYCRPTFDPGDWDVYRRVNERFAAAVLEEARGGPALVFVQDYHFALLPRLLKAARPDLAVAQFWHIPWPNPETFRVCPWTESILEGMLGNDLLSFHTQYHCNNFLETVDRTLECRIEADHFTVARRGRRTRVRPHPISVDPDLAGEYLAEDWELRSHSLREQLGIGTRTLLLGADRIDYTKGIPERLRAVGRLLEKHPSLKGQIQFLQVGSPSRSSLPAYRAINDEVQAAAAAVNDRHGRPGWQPIVFHAETVAPEDLFPLFRSAAACVVSSLHDGMNLVAKEFVSARDDEQGVLLLSRFTGAASELHDAVSVNPYDIDGFADALHEALSMPPPEQQRRMRRMRAQVADHNVYRWAGTLLSEASKLLPEESHRIPGDDDEEIEIEELDELLGRLSAPGQTWFAWGS